MAALRRMGAVRGSWRCLTCKGEFWWRFQVGYDPKAPFAAPCPHCGELLRGILTRDGLSVSCASSDVEDAEWKYEERGLTDDSMLNLSTEVPLRSSAVHENNPFTPFMQLTPLLDEFFEQRYKSTYPLLHPKWEIVGRMLPQMAHSHLKLNGKLFRQQAERMRGTSAVMLPKGTPATVALMLATRVLPYGYLTSETTGAIKEIHSLAAALSNRGGDALRSFVDSATTADAEFKFRRKAWLSIANLSERQGALLTAHVAEAIQSKTDVSEYRSMRGDYDDLSIQYLRAFETASKGLAFWKALQNAVLRGDPEDFGGGKRKSLRAMLKLNAHQRESWAAGDLGTLYSRTSRAIRNDIGHDSVHYDFRTGNLEFDDGKTVSLVAFQVHLLDVLRISLWSSELAGVIELLGGGGRVPKEVHRWPTMDEAGRTMFRIPD